MSIGAVVTGFVAAPAQADPRGDYSQVYVPKARTNGPVYGVTAGPGGNMWFTAFDTNVIGRITPRGDIATCPTPTANSRPFGGIAAGPDGSLWFSEYEARKITLDGIITEYPTPRTNTSPGLGAAGADGSIRFSEQPSGPPREGRLSAPGASPALGRALARCLPPWSRAPLLQARR